MGFRLSWNSIPDAETYHIYFGNTAYLPLAQMNLIATTPDTTYTAEGVAAPEGFYRVTANSE